MRRRAVPARWRPIALMAAVAAVAATASSWGASPGIAPAAWVLPPVRHVFVIVLENECYDVTLAPIRKRLTFPRRCRRKACC